jgi:cyclophilin family peptidyl-prolyl cis-trans isomerase/HEAT repeat protein
VRAAAAFAIGETEDRELVRIEGRQADAAAARELRALLDDTAIAVRMRAIEALGKIGTESDALEIVKCLENCQYDGSPSQRTLLSLSITALMRLRNPAARPTLEGLAGLQDPEIQWRAANAFYRMRDKTSRPVLERLLQSRNPDVQAHAARALGICGDPALAPLLIPLLSAIDPRDGSSRPLPVRVCALQALAALGNPQAVPAIEAALATIRPSDPDQLNFAVQSAAALGNIESKEGTDTLERLVLHTGPVANGAVVALARKLRTDPDRFFQVLSGTTFDSGAGARARAAALGELGGPRALGELEGALMRAAGTKAQASDAAAIPAVLQALARAQAPNLQEILGEFLASSDDVILRAAVAVYKPAVTATAPWKPLLQAYAAIAAGMDAESKTTILNRLEPWISAAEIQITLRSALQDRARNVRLSAARLLRMAGATDVPAEPGPADTHFKELAYIQAATARKDRTVAILDTTRGRIEIELFREDAPLTVANFISLAKNGFFDGLAFMRVVPYFVIQGGDPRNDQSGGPGYAIACEINMRPFDRGSVGMALSGKDTGGSQFFITLSPQPHLDGGYTCFGRVIGGMPAVERMVAGDRILKVSIEEELSLIDYR